MTRAPRTLKPFHAWIAVSGSENVAWFLGIWRTRGGLELEYSKRFGHSLRTGGYEAARVNVFLASTTVKR